MSVILSCLTCDMGILMSHPTVEAIEGIEPPVSWQTLFFTETNMPSVQNKGNMFQVLN